MSAPSPRPLRERLCHLRPSWLTAVTYAVFVARAPEVRVVPTSLRHIVRFHAAHRRRHGGSPTRGSSKERENIATRVTFAKRTNSQRRIEDTPPGRRREPPGKRYSRRSGPARLPKCPIRLPAPSTGGTNARDGAVRQGRVGWLEPHVACVLDAAPVTKDIRCGRIEPAGTCGFARRVIEPLKTTQFVVDTALVDGSVAGSISGEVGHREAGRARRVRRRLGKLSGRTWCSSRRLAAGERR
jgi:hypothetical protein